MLILQRARCTKECWEKQVPCCGELGGSPCWVLVLLFVASDRQVPEAHKSMGGWGEYRHKESNPTEKATQ